jgi:signal transduction histidine kinase/putative methionine-R-sulfoxide reductase with GAF domain
VDEHELRSVTQLRFLHGLASRLNALDDVSAIADAITTELETLIDYHNCRIYLLQDDGVTLFPIVFRGSLGEYESETLEELVSKVGEGITGHVAEVGETHYAADALHDPISVQIPGTSEIDESILAVPLKVGERVTGVVVLSNLGLDQFDDEDIRVLEVLSSHAAVAFENARLLQQERQAAATASALLGLSQSLTGAQQAKTVLQRVTVAVPSLIDAAAVLAYLRDPDDGVFHLVAQRGLTPDQVDPLRQVRPEIAATLLSSLTLPFVIPVEAAAFVPPEYLVFGEIRSSLLVPLRWEPDGLAVVVAIAPDADASYSERDLTLARGVGDIASLALGSAKRFHELERFHELVQSLDAIFWEAEPRSLEFTFLSRRASTAFGRGDSDPPIRSWGDHVHADDRERVVAALRERIEAPGEDLTLEYRALEPERGPAWLRDLVHVATDPRGEVVLRGLIVDITQRKRAEQALRRSEHKYSEAFRREREATQRLRALDEMKNTFLEAVSHDLRTPLTSILGSAVTLEQSGLDIPREDALDLLRRIAANARKLERLLGDLLDLDRLQRGIVAPQRRPTDVTALVAQTIRESEVLVDRKVELEAEPVVADIDAAKVERIVENLVSNAVRHTPEDSPVLVRVAREDGGVLIAVEDEGPGVPDDLKRAIFEPFRQGNGVPNPSPGVGVGLSLVARFAELHGGRAWVEDRPEGGASFRVFLPGSS